jgi:hypothetical protein
MQEGMWLASLAHGVLLPPRWPRPSFFFCLVCDLTARNKTSVPMCSTPIELYSRMFVHYPAAERYDEHARAASSGHAVRHFPVSPTTTLRNMEGQWKRAHADERRVRASWSILTGTTDLGLTGLVMLQ